MNALPKLHTINATAAVLGVSRNTVYRFARQGRLVRIKIGENSSRITEESIRSLVDGGKVASMVATGWGLGSRLKWCSSERFQALHDKIDAVIAQTDAAEPVFGVNDLEAVCCQPEHFSRPVNP